MNLAYSSVLQRVAFRRRHEQGIVCVTGSDRQAWLNGLLTNDIENARDCYAAWLTPQGRMITDMFVIARDDDTLLEVPASLAAALTERLDRMVFAEDVRVADCSADVIPVEVWGPDAQVAVDAARHAVNTPVAVRAVDRPVSGAVLYIPGRAATGALEALTHSGAYPLDDQTAEVLRVEAGVPRFLVDMDEDTIPLEAGLDHAISHTKGCYVGQEIIVRIRDRAHGRVARRLVGLELETQSTPATGQAVLLAGRQVGRLTSAVHSVALNRAIGLAILHRDAAAGSDVTLEDGTVARVTALPFVSPGAEPRT